MTDLILDRLGIAALADARHHARASLAALRSMNLAAVPADRCTELSRIGSALADVIGELERLEQRARLAP